MSTVPVLSHFHSADDFESTVRDRQVFTTSSVPDKTLMAHAIHLALEGNIAGSMSAVPDSVTRDLFDHLLKISTEHPAFAPGSSSRVVSSEPGVITIRRESRDRAEHVLCVHNLTSTIVSAMTTDDIYTDLISGAERGARMKLRPHEIAWLSRSVALVQPNSGDELLVQSTMVIATPQALNTDHDAMNPMVVDLTGSEPLEIARSDRQPSN